MKDKYIHPNTRNLLEPYLTSYKTDEEYKDNSEIITLIKIYTKQKEKSLFKILTNAVLRHFFDTDLNNIKIDKEKNNYKYINKDGKIISFDKLSKYIDDKALKKELTSNKRYHKCHEMSMVLSQNIKDSKILTGYIVYDGYKILHSVVEIERDDKIEFLDWTQNLIMDKDDYIKLFNFTSLSEISSINLINDIKLIKEIIPDMSSKIYLVFRDEIMRDLEKNNFKSNSKKKIERRSLCL